MPIEFIEKAKKKFIEFLLHEPNVREFPLCDFDRIQYELRPCDVILIEGRSRVSEVIRAITQSTWSHAALFIGRIHEIENLALRDRINELFHPAPDEQLIIESMLGRGTIVTPLSHYKDAHIRICRPSGISRQDAQRVIAFAIGRLGREYGIRHNLDLARFLLPWRFVPRRWRSTLFEQGESTKEICSSMLAEAFASVNFPVLPIVKSHKDKGVQFYKRNPKLFIPSDFDYSPYFEIIKYPLFEISGQAVYRNLPWNETGIMNFEDEAFPIEEKPAATDKPAKEDKKTSEDNSAGSADPATAGSR